MLKAKNNSVMGDNPSYPYLANNSLLLLYMYILSISIINIGLLSILNIECAFVYIAYYGRYVSARF